MKGIFSCILLLTLFLTACGGAEFDGSRIGNDRELTMEFKTLNRTDTQELTVEEGETIHGEIRREKGDLSVGIQKGEETPVYEAGDFPEPVVFDIAPEAGTYTVSVAGSKAKGSVRFTVEPAA